jgi:hypothetical protein
VRGAAHGHLCRPDQVAGSCVRWLNPIMHQENTIILPSIGFLVRRRRTAAATATIARLPQLDQPPAGLRTMPADQFANDS